MLYLSAFDFNGDEMSVTITNSEIDKSIEVYGDEKIKYLIRKSNPAIEGLKLVGDIIIVTPYNKELIKLVGKKNIEIGIKAHLRNWIKAIYVNCNEYEYRFIINEEKVTLKREYLLLQDIQIDVTQKFKTEVKEFKDVALEDYFFKGYVKETIQPTAEELKEEARKRRELQEKYRLEAEQRKKEEKEKVKEARKLQRLQAKENIEAQKRILEAQRIQEQMRKKRDISNKEIKAKEVKEIKEETKKVKSIFNPNKKFKVPTQEELLANFKTKQFYKGFKILVSNSGDDLAIVYTKAKPIYSKLIKGYVPSGGMLIVPIDTIAALKRWLNSEFYS